MHRTQRSFAWGNAFVRSQTVDASGAVTGIEMDLHLEGDFCSGSYSVGKCRSARFGPSSDLCHLTGMLTTVLVSIPRAHIHTHITGIVHLCSWSKSPLSVCSSCRWNYRLVSFSHSPTRFLLMSKAAFVMSFPPAISLADLSQPM
jgi:hypothetical protein